VALVLLRIVWVLGSSGRLLTFLGSRLGVATLIVGGLLCIALLIFPVAGFLAVITGIVLGLRRLFVGAKPRRVRHVA
jgi:hypothetical protein